MSTIFSKLLVWLQGQAVFFILILIAMAAMGFYTAESQHMGGSGVKEAQEQLLRDTQTWCDAHRSALEELKRGVIGGMKVHIPGTDAHRKALELSLKVKACEQDISNIKKKLDGFIKAASDSKYKQYVEPYLRPAFIALLFMFLVPKVLKVISFYVLAPMASRRPPLVIDPGANGREHSAFKSGQPSQISAVSQSVILMPNQNLLIQADYLQTSPLHAKKSTKWLLNNKMPLSSLSSGMYMLNRVECSTTDPIVISSTNDQFSEIGVVELPEGAAFVC